MTLSQPIDKNLWDWTWSWYPSKLSFAELQQRLSDYDLQLSHSVADITNDYIDCHRVLMKIANVAEAEHSGFCSSAVVRANRWKPMLLAKLDYRTLRFPVVTCLEFLNVSLLSLEPTCRPEIVEVLSAALKTEPQWGRVSSHRIWWCVDGAKPERLNDFVERQVSSESGE